MPNFALRLLDEYFASADRCDDARAHTFRADAYLALGEVQKAVDAYEAALAHERAVPTVRTQSRIELPFLIAVRQIRGSYHRAMELLTAPETMLLPVQRYKYHAALALISFDLDNCKTAKEHAREALQETELEHSGLRYHPQLGLVADRHEDVRRQLERIVESRG